MRDRERKTAEVFGPYALWLHTTWWPSINEGRKDTEQIDIDEMPPQRAAACLAKLVRWARYEPQGDLAALDDMDMREEEARTSVMGRHLAARALNLSEPQMHALFGEVGQGEGVNMHEIAAELTVSMADPYPKWGLKERMALGYHLAEQLDERFVVRRRSKDG